MKKFITVLLIISLASFLAIGCSKNAVEKDVNTIKVGVSPVPHAEIMEIVKPLLAEKGVNLDIVEYTDYIQPNLNLADGELDANYFQHIPYLESFCKDHNLDLTYIAKVHIEPMGVYSQKINSLDQLKEGASVAIPNDPTNGGRSLMLLDSAGVIKLKEGAGITATVNDINQNFKNVKIQELEAATLPRVLQDVDAAVINTNYALEVGLVPTKDALFIEDSDSPYVNILAVHSRDENNPALTKLAEVLKSEEVKQFIEEKYKGAVVPAF